MQRSRFPVELSSTQIPAAAKFHALWGWEADTSLLPTKFFSPLHPLSHPQFLQKSSLCPAPIACA